MTTISDLSAINEENPENLLNDVLKNYNATLFDIYNKKNLSYPLFVFLLESNSSIHPFNRNHTFVRSTEEWTHFYDLALSWQGIFLVTLFFTFIVITIIGNTLVILAVITTRRLKTITNCFVMSLAVADLLVGIFVMPPAVAVHLIGSWQLGWILCDIWISLDVLLCTASILSLCAISVDRYLAVTQPLTYSRKRRSKRLALIMILVVWILALAITCPPMLGWYEPGRRDLNECRYNQNKGYVIFSAMGSFFIPMSVMIYVYARISCVVASRHDNMTDISVHNKKFKKYTSVGVDGEVNQDNFEQDLSSGQKKHIAAARTLSSQTINKELHEVVFDENDILSSKNGLYELATSSRPSSLKRQQSFAAINSTNVEKHWSCSGQQRHSVRHHLSTTLQTTTDIYNSRNSRNTRNLHQQKSLSNRITSLKKENKTTQTLSIVVGGFIACWMPFFIYYLITPFLAEHQVSRTLANILTWLGWFNSAINPFIYAFYSVDFRVAFYRLTFKRFFSSSAKAQFPSNTMSTRR